MPGNGAQTEITPELLREAAILHYVEGLSWELVGKRLRTTARTLYNWRQKEVWGEIAAEVVDELKAQALPTSYGALLRNAHLGDTQAAKALLDRCEGAVAQTVGLHGVAGEAPVALAWWQGIEQAQKGADDGGGEGE